MAVEKTRSVVVTGVGVVSSLGDNVEEFWQSCLRETNVVCPIPECWEKFYSPKSRFWVPLVLPDYKALGFKGAELMQFDPVTLNALIATEQAIRDASIRIVQNDGKAGAFSLGELDENRIGVFIGSGVGGVGSLVDGFSHNAMSHLLTALGKKNTALDLDENIFELVDNLKGAVPQKFNPFVVPKSMVNAVAAAIGIRYGLRGPVRVQPYACASGTYAIADAYHAIANGEIDFAVCGGSEYLDDYCGTAFRGFDSARVLANASYSAHEINRPFDGARSGFVFAAGGSGVLFLESENSARARGADIYARVLNAGFSFDAHHMMSAKPDGSEVYKMLECLLKKEGLSSRDVGYVNSHGTGTALNDEVEAEVIERLFPHGPYVNASKSILGHTIGASGALEAIITVLSLKHQTTHITKNLQKPVRDLNFVQSRGPHSMRMAVSQSFAFGGHNAALLFGLV